VDECRTRGVEHFIFLGDLLDRGPDPIGTIERVAELKRKGQATVIMGNHDWKLVRLFDGNKGLHLSNEAKVTLNKLKGHDDKRDLYHSLFSERIFAVFDMDAKIMLCHAPGMRPYYLLDRMKDGETVPKRMAMPLLYGKTNGEKDSLGFPVRLPLTESAYDDLNGWLLVHGHTHARELHPEHGNPNILCVDYGAGEANGKLAAWIFAEDPRDTGELILSEGTTFGS